MYKINFDRVIKIEKTGDTYKLYLGTGKSGSYFNEMIMDTITKTVMSENEYEAFMLNLTNECFRITTKNGTEIFLSNKHCTKILETDLVVKVDINNKINFIEKFVTVKKVSRPKKSKRKPASKIDLNTGKPVMDSTFDNAVKPAPKKKVAAPEKPKAK